MILLGNVFDMGIDRESSHNTLLNIVQGRCVCSAHVFGSRARSPDMSVHVFMQSLEQGILWIGSIDYALGWNSQASTFSPRWPS
jgi:hypothetical protein